MDFTQRGLEKVTTPGNYWDPDTPGLVLRITKAGARSWAFVYRMGGRSAKKRWLKLGDFDALPLNRAQKQARAYHVQVENGVDPGQALRAAATEGTTVAELWEKFEAEHLPKKAPKTQAEYQITARTHILPALGKATVRDLTRDHVTRWHAAIKAPTAANRALALLSSMMTLAIELWDMREAANPCRRVERNAEAPRLRDITTAELEALGRALRALEGQHSLWALAAVRVVLLCWGRVSEVLALRRDRDVHLEEGYALVRDHKAKRKMGAKRLELPPPAVKILRTLPEEKGNPYYFPGRRRGQHLTRMGLYHTWQAVCTQAGIEDLHLHDSRSLAASEAEAQGLNPKTAAAVLGHKDIRTTEKHYARVRKAREGAAAVAAPIAAALDGKRVRKRK